MDQELLVPRLMAGEAFLRRQWDNAASGGGYPFVIVRLEDNRSVGSIGLRLTEIDRGRGWLGYSVAASARVATRSSSCGSRTTGRWAPSGFG